MKVKENKNKFKEDTKKWQVKPSPWKRTIYRRLQQEKDKFLVSIVFYHAQYLFWEIERISYMPIVSKG